MHMPKTMHRIMTQYVPVDSKGDDGSRYQNPLF